MGSSILQAILGGVAGGASGITAVREQRRLEEEQRQKAEEAKRQAERQAMLDIVTMADRPGWTTPEQRSQSLRQAAPGLQSLAGAAGAMMRGGAPSPVDMESVQRGAGQFGAPGPRVSMGGREFMQTETPTARALREAEFTAGQDRRKTQEASQAQLAEQQRTRAAAEAERVATVEAMVGAGIPRPQAEAASRTGARYGDVMETPSIAATKRGQDISAATARRGQDLAEGRAAAGAQARADARAEIPALAQRKLEGVEAGLMMVEDIRRSIESYPEGLGSKNFLWGAIINRVDPKGVGVRAEIENLSGEIRNQRFGGALTKNEAEFAERNLPSATDRADAAFAKLTALSAYLETKRRAAYSTYGLPYAPYLEESSSGASPDTARSGATNRPPLSSFLRD
jgi:hypothetical protein